MTKKDLIEQVENKIKSFPIKVFSKFEIEIMLDVTFESIGKELSKNNGEVFISKFGKFNSSTREYKNSRNPKTGEKVPYKKMKIVKFKVAKALKNGIQ